MAQADKTSKTMSSRLLSMKFMQRGASATSSPPSTPAEPPSKRQRLSDVSYRSGASTPQSESRAVAGTPASEDPRRDDLLEQEAARRGDTQWYLSFKDPTTHSTAKTPLRIVSAGYAALDGPNSLEDGSNVEDDEVSDESPQIQGRMNFGRFKRKEEENAKSSSSDDSDSDEPSGGEKDEEDASDDPIGANELIAKSRKEAGDKVRAERKAKKKAVKAEAAQLGEERRKKQLKLNGKGPRISNGGGSSTDSSRRNITCRGCGQKGHIIKDCPMLSSR